MSFASVLDEIDAHNRAVVERETWGHLDAAPGHVYDGHILFAVSCFGDGPIAIDVRFIDRDDKRDLESSPWFYEDLNNWMLDAADEPGVYRFDGSYRVFKNGKHRFSGKVRPVRLTH